MVAFRKLVGSGGGTTTTTNTTTTTTTKTTTTTASSLRGGDNVDGDDDAVNLFWLEKTQIFFDFLQMYGVLWLIAARWPWPQDWLLWSRFGPIALLDFPTLAHVDGNSYSGVVHIVLLVYTPLVLAAALLCIRTLYSDDASTAAQQEQQRQRQPRVVQWLQRRRVRLNAWALVAAELLYLPAVIAMYRMLLCIDGNVVGEVSGSLVCWSAGHVSLLMFTLPPLVLFIAGLPYTLWKRCSTLAVFNESALHEKYLRSREIEQLMRLNTMHSDEHFFVMSSYRRPFVQSKAAHAAYKFTVVTVLYVLGPNVWDVRKAQAVLFCMLTTVTMAMRVLVPQYRVATSNTQANILTVTLSVLALVGIFSSTGEQSAFLVDDTLRVILTIIFIVGLVIYLGHLVIIVAVRDRHEWPVTQHDVEVMWTADHEMIQSILQARAMLDNLAVCPLEFTRKHEILAVLKMLERMRTKAQKQHVALEWTLQDTVEDMAYVYENMKEHSLLPNPALERLVSGVDDAMHRKHYDTMLMNAAKRTTLTRLQVLGQLLGDAYVASDKSEYMERTAASARATGRDPYAGFDDSHRHGGGGGGGGGDQSIGDSDVDGSETSYSTVDSLV